MKLPMPAPALHQALTDQSDSIVQVIGRGIGPEVNGAYEHWDKVRHRTPPSGLTPELWWLGIKLARNNLAREIPLLDDKQRKFRVSLTSSMYRRLHYIDREAAGAMEGSSSSVQGTQTYLIRSLIEEAMTSSQLEGAATTRAVAKEMLSTGRPPRDHGETMIFNNYTVMKDIREWQDRPFTPEAIMEIHRTLTANTLEADECGRLRTAADNIVLYDRGSPPTLLHTPPPASQLPDRLQRLCDFANEAGSDEFLHPVVRAIAIHFQIGYDHPFCDGNGRTARILFYWSMLKAGYWLTEFLSISTVIKKSMGSYLKAYLHTESDERDLSYFVAQQLEVVERAIQGLHDYIARKAKENRQAEKLLRSADILGENLNHRQRALLANAIHEPGRSYTVATHQTAHRVTYPTALNDLKGLERVGLLQKRKLGKALHFWPAADLGEKLALER
jgi:Fic family protein